jgi:uncharacterized RDD family membrane protein YckC
MKICTKCQHSQIRDTENYCPNCGSRDLVLAPANSQGGIEHLASGVRVKRMGAFLIDLVIIIFLSTLSSMLPFLGVIPAIVVTLYQLLRDYSGASVGKRILRLKVVNRNGGPATSMQCILRNIIFVVPSIALFITALGIPGVGFLIDGTVLLIFYIIEVIFLLATGTRVGDRLAGTTVVNA